MKIKLTDNVTNNLLDTLRSLFPKANEIKLGIAFVKYSGFSLVEDSIRECLKNGGRAEFVLGLDFRTTEPKVLRILDTMAKSGLSIKLLCFSDPSVNDTALYHPKIYLIRKRDQFVISIGSSNLTSGGLKDNAEVNAIIEASAKEKIVSDIYAVYNRFKFQRNAFEPNLAYIERYEEVYEIVRKKSSEALKERRTENRIKDLKERERILPKPKPGGTELLGWQKLVYEKLPGGTFQTGAMYIYEKEFQQFYPENRHIRDKVRQILQQLRDLGLLKHISTNKWIKV